MNNDLISREDLIKAVEDLYEYAELGEVLDVIKEAPAVEERIDPNDIYYLCDHKRCGENFNCYSCNHTTDIRHAVNFDLVEFPRSAFFERARPLDNTPEVPSNMTLIPTAVLDDLTKTTRELGEWVEEFDDWPVVMCSVCRSEYCLGEMTLDDVRREFKYCPHCGALMTASGNNETE